MTIAEFKVGDKAVIKHTITEKDLDTFVDLTGDDNPLHVSEDFAAGTSFKKPVVHGMLGASFISTIIGTKLPGPGALWFSQSLDFLLPVRIGDKITVKAEIININKRQGILELQTDIFNQHKKKVVNGKANIKLVPKEAKKNKKKTTKFTKTALIIGASGGIGSTIAKTFADQNYNVGLHYHSNEKEINKLKKSLKIGERCSSIKADILDYDQAAEACKDIFKRYGRLDVLVNCATEYVAYIDFDNLSWEDFSKHLDVQVKGTFNLLKAAVPYMEKNKYGKIINISSQATDQPFPDMMPYIAAKSALSGLSKSAALDLAKKGIRVNIVSPGMTDTDLNADLPEKARLLTEAKTPMRRLARPDDVAAAVAYLASSAADFITGETIRVNGGQTMI